MSVLEQKSVAVNFWGARLAQFVLTVDGARGQRQAWKDDEAARRPLFGSGSSVCSSSSDSKYAEFQFELSWGLKNSKKTIFCNPSHPFISQEQLPTQRPSKREPPESRFLSCKALTLFPAWFTQMILSVLPCVCQKAITSFSNPHEGLSLTDVTRRSFRSNF